MHPIETTSLVGGDANKGTPSAVVGGPANNFSPILPLLASESWARQAYHDHIANQILPLSAMSRSIKLLYYFIAPALILMAFSTPEDPQPRKVLNEYKRFVDSICRANNEWKASLDTDIYMVEMPIDPADLTKRRWDTTFITPAKKKTILYSPDKYGSGMSDWILKEYQQRLVAVNSVADEFSKSMRKEYKVSKKKFESLMPPEKKKIYSNQHFN